MTRRLHVLLATVCLTSAFAAGAVYWTGTFVFGQEDKPAKTQVIGSAAAEDPAPVVVNGREWPDLPHAIDAQGGWSFRYERDLRSDPAEWLKKDAPRTDMRWKGWEANADKWRNGLFGSRLTFQLEFPHWVQSVTAAAVVGNFADTATRTALLEYSFDNVLWRPIAKVEYGTGTKEFSGTAAIRNAQVDRLWIRLRQGAGDANAAAGGSVVFQKFSFSVNGLAEKRGPEDLVLVVPDQPMSVPGSDGLFQAELTQMAAAERLRMLIGEATRAWPRIVPAAQAPKNGRRIYVGYGPHLEGRVKPPTQPEGLRIIERNGDLYLLGEIAKPGVNNWPGPADRGVMHAVETFAERVMGYRFLYSPPDDFELFGLGTVIPSLDTLKIEAGLSIEESPAFLHRVPYGTPSLGLRSGSSTAFSCNHSYHVEAWAAMYAEKHPEMFVPKVPDAAAKTDDAQVAALGAQRHLNFLDYTEPLVLEKRLEHLQTFFEGKGAPGFYRVPTLKYIMEEPPDMPPPSFQYNERSRALWNPKADPWGGFSNIWFDYQRRLGGEVKTRWPHMRISSLAYMRHYDVPTFAIPDNVDVMIALMRSSMASKEPDVFAKNLAHVKKWSEYMKGDRSRLYLWEYGEWPAMNGVTPPQLCPFAMQKWLQAVRPYVSGVMFEWYDPAEYSLMARLWARLLWNPDLDVAAEIADLCRHSYGPAGDTMTAFYRRLIERYEMPWKNPELAWGQFYLTPDLYYGQSLPPEEIERLAALLEQARREVGLPAVVEAKVQDGSAVHLTNSEKADVSVRIGLTALEHELVNPAIGWDGGRIVWRGRLKPGERLDIASLGQARLTAADGSVSEVGGDVQGQSPTLAAGRSDVFHFWHAGPQRDARFKTEVRYGPEGQAQQSQAQPSIHARRLAWVRDPYLVFQPTGGIDFQRGLLAEAHLVHQHLGRVPVYEAVRVDTLPKGIEDALWRDLPAAQLVRGREDGRPSYERNGFPANRRTQVQFVHAPDGLAARIVADGAPAEAEKLVLHLNGKAFEFVVSAKPVEGAALRQLEIGQHGWRGLAVVQWRELGLTKDAIPAEISAQIQRDSAADRSLWSPPLGSAWDHRKQGPGRLRFVKPPASSPQP